MMSACYAQAQRSLEASSQVHRRLMQRSTVAPHGGWGGRRQDRRFLYSRYRSVIPQHPPSGPAARLASGYLSVL